MHISKTKLFKLILVNLLIYFIFIELALRLFTPVILQERLNANVLQTSDFQKLFNKVEFRFEKHSTGKAKHNEWEHEVTHDDIGFRNTCLKNRNKHSKILFIGDSAVYGLGVIDEETIPCHLTKLGIPTYSLSVPGADIFNYLQLMQKHLESLIVLLSTTTRCLNNF